MISLDKEQIEPEKTKAPITLSNTADPYADPEKVKASAHLSGYNRGVPADVIHDEMENVGVAGESAASRQRLKQERNDVLMSRLDVSEQDELVDFVKITEHTLDNIDDPIAALAWVNDPENPGSIGDIDRVYEYYGAERLNRAIEEVSQEFDRGFFGDAAGLLSEFLQVPINVFTLNWFRDLEKRDKIQAMTTNPNVTDEELKDMIREFVAEEADNADVFMQNNSWYAFSALDSLRNKRTLTDGDLFNAVFGAIDIATFGGTRVLKAATALSRGGATSARIISGGATSTSDIRRSFLLGRSPDPDSVLAGTPDAGRFPFNGDIPNSSWADGSIVGAARETSKPHVIRRVIDQFRARNPVDLKLFEANYETITRELYDKMIAKGGLKSRLLQGNVVQSNFGAGVTQSGNIKGWALLGTAYGRPFKIFKGKLDAAGNPVPKNQAQMERTLEDIGKDAKLVAINDEEAVLVKTFNVKPQEFDSILTWKYEPSKQWEFAGVSVGSILNYMGSAAGRLDKSTKAAMLQSEALQNKKGLEIKKLIDEDFGKLTDEEYRGVDLILKKITDGELTTESGHLDKHTFFTTLHEADGVVPSEASWKAYTTATQLDDYTWEVLSDRAFTEALELGYEDVVHIGDDFYPSAIKKATGDVDAKVIDASTGAEVMSGTLDLTKGSVFDILPQHRTRRDVRQVYVSGKARVSAATPIDILPWRPGFSRQYIGDNYYVKISNRSKNGNKAMLNRPTTIGYAQTSIVADKAVAEINSLFDAMRQALGAGPMSLRATRKALDALSKEQKNNIVEVLQKNNSWAPDLDSWRSLRLWLRREEVDIFGNVGKAAKNDVVQETGPDGEVLRFGGATYGRMMEARPTGINVRSDRPIRNLSGKDPVTMGGLEGMYAAVSNAVNVDAWKAVTTTEVRRWKKAAMQVVKNREEIENLPGLAALRRAEIDPSMGLLHEQLEAARTDILRAFNMQENMADDWYLRTGEKLATLVSQTKLGDNARLIEKVRNGTAKLPDKIRMLAYHLKLGLFNPTQLLVQSSQMAQIAAMHPVLGTRAIPMVLSLRAYRHAVRMAGVNVTDVRREFAEKFWKMSGLRDAEEFEDFLQLMQDSGRLDVMHNVAEAGGAMNVPKVEGARSKTGTAINNSTVFFEEGERWPRMLAGAVSYLKRMDELGDARHARKDRAWQDQWWNEQDDLTFNMTSALSAPWQRSNFAVTFQFMTYMARTVEMMTRRSGFSRAERARLLAGNILMFGGTGVGVGGYMDRNRAEGGYLGSMSDEEFELMRRGAIGALWDGMGVGDITMRIAPAQGIIDWLDGVQENSYVETIIGPGGTTALDIGGDVTTLFTNLMTFEGVMLREDMIKVASNVSTLSNASKAYLAAQYGKYYMRRGGTPVASDMTTAEIFGIVAGFTPDSVHKYYRNRDVERSHKQAIKEIGQTAGRLMMKINQAMEDGDTTTAINVQRQLFALLTPVPTQDRHAMKKYFRDQHVTMVQRAYTRQVQDGMNIFDNMTRGE